MRPLPIWTFPNIIMVPMFPLPVGFIRATTFKHQVYSSLNHTQGWQGRLRPLWTSKKIGDYDNSMTHSGNAIPRGPPSRPQARPQPRPNNSSPGPVNRFLSRLVNRGGNQQTNQTATPVPPPSATGPQQVTCCRFPGCKASVTGDIAIRLNGFCCNSHRDRSSGTL
ncbi:hypothetical protein H4582DRAFT_1044836 [Lactarius indigo]|nr:hypothetical protein H4582DRAFT_1044836 [Lactarius indigo]